MDSFFINLFVLIVALKCLFVFLKIRENKKNGKKGMELLLGLGDGRKKRHLLDDMFPGDNRGPLGMYSDDD